MGMNTFVPRDICRALVEAVKHGDVEQVSRLTSKLSAHDLQHIVGPVFSIAHTTPIVELLLQQGVDVNSVSETGASRLHIAAAMSDTSEIRLLASRGANPNARDADGMTPLFFAETCEALEAIHTMVSVGADVDAQCNDGGTALHWAAGNGRIHSVRALLECGASTHLRDKWGNTPLIAVPGLRDECREQGSAIAGLLLGRGADVCACNNRGWQAIHYAARNAYDDLLTTLIQAGANPHAETREGYTAQDVAESTSTLLLLQKVTHIRR